MIQTKGEDVTFCFTHECVFVYLTLAVCRDVFTNEQFVCPHVACRVSAIHMCEERTFRLSKLQV